MSDIKVRSYDELSDLEKLCLTDFSYSRIDTYLSCPAKYFYSYIQKEPRQFSAPAVLGNIVHEVLENCLDNDKPLDFRELKQDYIKNIPKWDPDGIIQRDLIDVGHVIIDEFFDRHSGEPLNIYAKEMPFNFVIGTYSINGFIDRVDVFDDRVRITDYKTGKWEVSPKDVPTNLQLGIYALAASLLFPEHEVYAELYYLRSGRRKGHAFSKDDIDAVKERIVMLANKIVNDQNFLPTDQYRPCSYCDHAKSGACGIGAYRNRNRN